jgi:NAD(P)-dependent dehydrogenase (short-subunit alcohol dehydrogenase family)
MDINFGGVYRSAQSCCRQMEKYGCGGSIVLVGSMSAFIANKGLRTSVYNCSKAAVVQLGRSLAMEWSSKGVRVNSLCPGNIVTPVSRFRAFLLASSLLTFVSLDGQEELRRRAAPQRAVGEREHDEETVDSRGISRRSALHAQRRFLVHDRIVTGHRRRIHGLVKRGSRT